ncbi:hypothetical protein PRBRB14_10560 [Hallella multisaccharivorax DSM 17128]|nr:hypothetical protein PRBRB14_10560 [Hallella multisaccharivorax DSM 17128]
MKGEMRITSYYQLLTQKAECKSQYSKYSLYEENGQIAGKDSIKSCEDHGARLCAYP